MLLAGSAAGYAHVRNSIGLMADAELGARYRFRSGPFIDAIEGFSKPLIAALNGVDWSKGLRLSLATVNLFARRQTVHDATGATPVAFEPGYVDPAGRTLWFMVRKIF